MYEGMEAAINQERQTLHEPRCWWCLLKIVQLREPFSEWHPSQLTRVPIQLTRQSKSLEGTLRPPAVSWGSWSGTKQVDAMAKSLACG